MSEDKPASPSTSLPFDGIKAATENLTSFVRWIAELVQKRNWVSLLLLVDVGLLLFFQKDGVVATFLQEVVGLQQLPDWYQRVFWFAVISIFLVAIAIAVKTMPRAANLEVKEGAERKVIKGLRSFTLEDADVFAKLQRNQSIQTCLESLKAKEFRFGVLMGESGCGKTSFLQAGVLPKLTMAESSCRGIYVKFSDRSPIETVKDALLEVLQTADSQPAQVKPEADLLTLLKAAPDVLQKPVVLFFDQFEQFFVHQRQKAEHRSFIDTLTQWYQAEPPAALKILVSIRADLVHELFELQQAMGYVLSRYDVFKLEKFAPEEATEILRVIAETEGWEFDRTFVMELAKDELTSSQGNVSPVDLQILAETVRKQPEERRAFKEETFRKMGGLEGLLNRYLEETLDVLKLNNLYQAAIQVLLALIDQERNVRSGVLTLAELEEKLKGTARSIEIMQATNWLASGEVRLITPVERHNTAGYELAHERIIPAIVRLAGQELKEAEKANLLLDRRVNEWIGNGRDRRYLLTWRELQLLRQQKASLVWGANRRDKERLLKQSWRRIDRVRWAILTALILSLVVFTAWLSPPGQLWQMQSRLAGLRKISSDSRAFAAIAFAKIGNQQQALNVVASIDSAYLKAYALSRIAKAYSQLDAPEVAEDLLKQARVSVEQINNAFFKAAALSRIAEAYSQLDVPEVAEDLLKQARASVEQIDDPSFKAYGLSAIAEAYSQLDALEVAKAGLEQARASAEQIDNVFYKAYALSAIAEAYSQFDALEVARAGLEQARASAEQIDDASLKAYALSAIAVAYSQLDAPEVAKAGLEQARTSAEQIDQLPYKAVALSRIAVAYSQLDVSQFSQSELKQLRTNAEQIDDVSEKARALSSIALIHAEREDWLQVNLIAASCPSNDCKADVLSTGLTVRAEQLHPELKEEEE